MLLVLAYLVQLHSVLGVRLWDFPLEDVLSKGLLSHAKGKEPSNANPKDSLGKASLSQRDPFGVGRSP